MEIAIIGASNDRSKYGNKAVRAYRDSGYMVYPINPKEETIEGLKAYKSVKEIPGEVETASFYVPPKIGLTLVDEMAEKGVKRVYLNPGAESDELYEAFEAKGIEAIIACSILAVGKTPDTY